MAEVGTGAAGSQLKRVGNYIAPQVNRGTDRLAAAFSQNRSIKATKENQEDAQLEKRLEGDIIVKDDYLTQATGVNGVDDFNRLVANVGIESAKGLFSQAREADTSGDREAADNFRAKASKVQSSFKNMVSDIPVVRAIMAGYEKDKASGKILDGSYQRMAIGGMIRGEVVPEIDDNGNWSLKPLIRDEEKGNPVLDENGKATYITYSMGDIKKGLAKPYYFNEETGKDGELNKILVSLGKSKVDEINGGYKDTNQVWDEQRQNSLNNFIEGTLSNDREMYKWHEYITGEEKFEDFTDAEKLKIRQRIQTGVEGAYSTEQTKTTAQMTVGQKINQKDIDRGISKEKSDQAQSNSDRNYGLAVKRLALAQFKQDNPKKGKATEKEELSSQIGFIYDVAQKISNLKKPDGKKVSEEEVQKLLEEEGIDLKLGKDLDNWVGFGQTEYDIGSQDGVAIEDTYENIKGIASGLGLEIESRDLKKLISGIKAKKFNEKRKIEYQPR